MSVEEIELLTKELDGIIDEGKEDPWSFDLNRFKEFCLKATGVILALEVQDEDNEYDAYTSFFESFGNLSIVLLAFDADEDDEKKMTLVLESVVAMFGVVPAVAQKNPELAEELLERFNAQEMMDNVEILEDEYPSIVPFKLGDKLTTIFNNIQDPERYRAEMKKDAQANGFEALQKISDEIRPHPSQVQERQINAVRKMSANRPKLKI